MKGKKNKQELQEAASLIEDITHESIDKRVGAAKKIAFIAEVLGGERVKSELLPFLRKCTILSKQKSLMMRLQ